MSKLYLSEFGGTATRSASLPVFCIAKWLHLAAAPTFAIMALLTSDLGNGQPHIFCSTMHDTSPLGGMVPMYLLMSAFHLPPWLKLIAGRQR